MLVGVAPHEDGLKGGKLEVGVRMLTDECHVLSQLTGGVLQHIVVIKHDCTLLRREQSSNETQQGGLTATIGSHDGVEVTVPKTSVDSFQHLFLSKGIRNIL